MNPWTASDLDTIGQADEIALSSLRADGILRPPVTIWVVTFGGSLYVRAVGGRSSPWFRGTQVGRIGHISVGAVERDVDIIDADDAIADDLDAAYRSKYHRYSQSTIDAVVSPAARSAALELTPRTSALPRPPTKTF